MPISYKNKIYTTLGTPTVASGNGAFVTNSVGVPAKDYTVKGKSIVWNQLLDKSKFKATQTIAGVNIKNNGDGTYTLNGTYTSPGTNWFTIYNDSDLSIAKRLYGHKVLYGFMLSTNSELESESCGMSYEINGYSSNGTSFNNNNSCVISRTLNKVSPSDITDSAFYIVLRPPSSGTAVYKNVVIRPQLFDLTQMFGAGNEPSTPAEFSAMFPDDYYPYNEGELKTIVPTSVETSTAERFQLLNKSKFTATTTINGVTFTNNGDGTITYNGTTTGVNYILQSVV